MKIQSITPLNSYTKSYNTPVTKANSFIDNNRSNDLSGYPKSYIKFHLSFAGSLADEIEKDNEANRNKRKDDYLWARNWDKEKARTEYLKQAEAEIKITSKINIQNPIKLVTFGFNSKSTITISSVTDENIVVCIQRDIEKVNKEMIECREKQIQVKNIKKIYNNLVIFIIKELHNL